MSEKKISKDKGMEIKLRTRFFGFKKKYIAYFLINKGERYELEGRKRIKTKGSITLNYRKKPFLIDIGNYTFSNGLKEYYLFDMLSGKQLFFEGSEGAKIPAEIVDMFVNKGILKNILNWVASKFGVNINSLITGIAIGVVIGMIIGVLLL